MIQYRKITTADLKQVVHASWKAFAPMSTEKEVFGWRSENDPPDEAAFGAFDEGRLAAKVHIVDQRENRIRGANLSFGGIGGVATLPEYRREHLIAELFRRSFDYMNEADIVFSALAPFSFPFYEKFGYAHAAQKNQYRFVSRLLKPARAPKGISMREYHPETDLEAVMNVQHSMARFGSRVFHTRHYLGAAEKKHRYVFEREGDVIGFIEYQFGKSDDGKSQILVNNAWFGCNECLPALVDLTYRFASQCERIVWEIDPEIPLEYYILEPGQVERTKTGYMMVRVVKFREFCQRIKVPLFASEPVIIQITDADCPWNDGVFKLTPVSGRLEVETSERAPEIGFDAVHLSHAIGGQLTANRLRRIGGLQCDTDAAERFTRIFPPDSYVTYTGF